MKILIITGSPRRGGNTDILAKAFADGANKNNDVNNIGVRRKSRAVYRLQHLFYKRRQQVLSKRRYGKDI